MKNLPPHFSYGFEVRGDPPARFHGRATQGFGTGLLGPAPELTWTEHTPAPWKLYARIILQSTARDAAAARIRFVIDRGLMTVLRPGDQLHIAALPALGLAIVRDGLLVAAAGPADVLAHLPLGHEVDVLHPGEDLESRFSRQPGSGRYFYEGSPLVEVAAAGETRIMPSGRATMGPYEVFVRASVRPETLLLSIERLNTCPETAAHTSAQLMDRDGYEVGEQR